MISLFSPKNHVPAKIQKEVFRRQLSLTKEYGSPLILHLRNSVEEGIQILEEMGIHPLKRIHFHCWTNTNPSLAFEVLQKFKQSYIGFTRVIKHNSNLKELVKRISMERCLLETDSPYFKDGNPYSLPQDLLHVADIVSQVKNLKLLDVCTMNLKNSQDMYPLAFKNN